MTGSIDTMSVGDAKQAQATSQSRLASFGDDNAGETTYIGIVKSEKDRYLNVVDGTEQRLSPPDELFHQWYQTKTNLLSDGYAEIPAHNEALERVNYAERFEDHLNGDAAQIAITSLTERVKNGEDIVLVCYCTEGKQCHRTQVAQRIQARL